MQNKEEKFSPFITNDEEKELIIWQICDSSLPVGSFAHSFGLEAAKQNGFLNETKQLIEFIECSLWNFSSFNFVFLTKIFESPSLPGLSRVNAIYHASLLNAVSRKASIAQASSFLRLVENLFEPMKNDCSFIRDKIKASSGQSSLHYTPLFGYFCCKMGFDLHKAKKLGLYLLARDLISAATRLSLIGPLQGSHLLRSFGPCLQNIIKNSCPSGNLSNASHSEPLIDLLQGAHEKLYSRLFSS